MVSGRESVADEIRVTLEIDRLDIRVVRIATRQTIPAMLIASIKVVHGAGQ